ncbi:MAG: hypothetical protein IT445_08275 [Phycisphaeraceae bacterium]|nr:hypothetical protein [Phycisphaeraceae bacterium]
MTNRHAILAGVLVCGAWWSCAALGSAHFSELFLAGVSGSPTPNAVELASLDQLSESAVDLVVLDAAADHPGRVLQVVTVPTSQPLLLISDQDWPPLSWFSPLSSAAVKLEQLDSAADTNWNFAFSRTLILLDRRTRLVAGGGTLSLQQDLLDGAQVLDLLTFKRVRSTVSFAGEPILDSADGYAISRPYDASGHPGSALIGQAEVWGHLTGLQPAYLLTPGLPNPIWPGHTPEPAGGAILLAAGALFWVRRGPIMDRYGR